MVLKFGTPILIVPMRLKFVERLLLSLFLCLEKNMNVQGLNP